MNNKESANELFHFTKKYDSIKSILNDKFKPFFCVEDFSYIYMGSKNQTLAFPMVCFCDIPLDRIAVHRSTYGDYGIGLTKDWGKLNNLNIVNYSFPESLKSSSSRILIDYYLKKCIGLDDDLSRGVKNALNILLTTSKPYEGKKFNKQNRGWAEEIRFYNEREWRYIPLINKLKWSVSLDEFSGNYEAFFKAIEEEQPKIQEQHKLDFTIDDITHIFLKDESEKVKLLKDIRDNYIDAEIEQIEKLICVEQIEETERGKEKLAL